MKNQGHSQIPRRDFHRLVPSLPGLKLSEEALEVIVAKMVELESPAKSTNIPLLLHIFLQFGLAHDSVDDTGSLGAPIRHRRNGNTPYLDLDCLYGFRPRPDLFTSQGKFILGEANKTASGRTWHDALRSPNGRAMFPDRRNDENLLCSQVHVLHQVCHNRMIDLGLTFAEARQEVTWAYQWMTLSAVSQITANPYNLLKSGHDREAWRQVSALFGAADGVALELTGAAMRTPHSAMIGTFRINADETMSLFDRPPFTPAVQFADFDYLCWVPGSNVQPEMAALLDTHMDPMLRNMPPPVSHIAGLAEANIRKGQTYQLPSGQQLARRLGIRPAPDTVFGLDHTPLWPFLLMEAQTTLGKGETLGQLGSVLLSGGVRHMMESNPAGYLVADRRWQPTYYRTLGEMVQFVRSGGPDE